MGTRRQERQEMEKERKEGSVNGGEETETNPVKKALTENVV